MKHNNKGFTLAELLIVVAIIAILVAVAIPTFSDQLEKSRESADISNLRSAYAEVVTASLENPTQGATATVALKQTQTNWQTATVNIAGADLKGNGATAPTGGGNLTVVYTPASGTTASTIKIADVAVQSKIATTNSNNNNDKEDSAASISGTGPNSNISLTTSSDKISEGNFTDTFVNLGLTITNGNTYNITNAKKDSNDLNSGDISASSSGITINSVATGTYTFTLEVYGENESSSTHNPATQEITITFED